MKYLFFYIASFSIFININAQWNFNFNYATYGQRVALVNATTSLSPAKITINFLDYNDNSGDNIQLSRRALNGDGNDWVLKANITAGTQSWTDTNVKVGDLWEYQVKRYNTSEFGFATGYVAAGLHYD